MEEKLDFKDDESHILHVLKEIRESLHTEGNLKEISPHFPISFMHNEFKLWAVGNSNSLKPVESAFYNENKNYMGFCDVTNFDWSVSESDANVRISRNYKVNRIVISIYKDHNNESDAKQLISMANIISVFLHELAHSITMGVCVHSNGSKWIEQEHPNEFYEQYKRILQTAEKLNIFSLGKSKDKYSMRNLKRFDNIDSTFLQQPKSCSMKYKHLICQNNNKDADFVWHDNSDINLIRLTVTYQKQQKLIVIKQSEWISNKNKICEMNGLLKKIHAKFPYLKKKVKRKNNNALNIFVSNVNHRDMQIMYDTGWINCVKNAVYGNGTVEMKIIISK